MYHLVSNSTGRILDFSNANTAVDQYHRFEVKVPNDSLGPKSTPSIFIFSFES